MLPPLCRAVRWLLPCLAIAHSGVVAAVQDAVADRFAPSSASVAADSYLGDRLQINLEKRLLAVDVDTFVEPFVHKPGVQPWVGEHAGKWLHAASLYWERTRDARLKSKLDHVAGALIGAQEPDGYLGTYLPADRWTSWDVWSHKYNLIGLLAYHRVTGDPAALQACRRMADLLCATFGEGRRDIIESGTHVGMAPTSVLEPMVALYRVTGEPRYLGFCEYLVRAWEQPNGPKLVSSLLTHGSVRRTANNKAYEMLSCLVGLLDLYRLTGETRYGEAARAAWRDIRDHQNYAIGSASWAEHFQEPDALRPDGGMAGDKYLGAAEGCVTVTWMQLTRGLLRLTGEPQYAEELERSIYNALLAAQSPLDGTVSYFLPLEGRKRFGEVTHGLLPDISCCASSIPRGLALVPELIAGTIDGSPTLLLYVPGRYTMQVRSGKETIPVTLRVETRYPESGKASIVVETPQTATFSLLLRVPAWSRDFQATAPDGGPASAATAGTFCRLERTWRNGDRCEISFSLPLFTVAQGKAAEQLRVFQRGPQVLAADEAVGEALPASWYGHQCYAVQATVAGQARTLHLVPFAEAGQTKSTYTAAFAGATIVETGPAAAALADYRAELDRFRAEFGGAHPLPRISFFLFGMGQRAKYTYRDGKLMEARSGRVVREWQTTGEVIVPPDYLVVLQTAAGPVALREDHEALWIEENGGRVAVEGTRAPVTLPDFAGHRYARVLRVLLQEILVNITPAGPVPNFFVYEKPWYRDAAMMAQVLQATDNLHTIKDWVLGLRDAYDRNNAGETEADNLGQALFLISLFAGADHPLVPRLLAEAGRFAVRGADGLSLKGRSDFAEHPVYQTKWMKYGLRALQLPDPYVVPQVADGYSALFWMDYRDRHLAGRDDDNRGDYPYLGWACDHFHGAKRSPISDRDYPLTWEANASQAAYANLRVLDPVFADAKLAAPHTWHAAEVFLYVHGMR